MKISPNMITLFAILLSFITGLSIWFYPSTKMLIILPIVLFIRMALNALDGMMAKNYNLQSKKGEVLNELGDIISDVFIFFPLFKLFHLNIYILFTFIILSLINEFTGILGKAISGERRYEGPMGKSDRALVMGLICLITYFNTSFINYVNNIFVACICLLIISTLIRTNKMLK
jgi:CDP-diacylglycerol--glycerol-3-phosphate 3-phosphatidyltransferase